MGDHVYVDYNKTEVVCGFSDYAYGGPMANGLSRRLAIVGLWSPPPAIDRRTNETPMKQGKRPDEPGMARERNRTTHDIHTYLDIEENIYVYIQIDNRWRIHTQTCINRFSDVKVYTDENC